LRAHVRCLDLLNLTAPEHISTTPRSVQTTGSRTLTHTRFTIAYRRLFKARSRKRLDLLLTSHSSICHSFTFSSNTCINVQTRPRTKQGLIFATSNQIFSHTCGNHDSPQETSPKVTQQVRYSFNTFLKHSPTSQHEHHGNTVNPTESETFYS
jgi:hypothetical protein